MGCGPSGSGAASRGRQHCLRILRGRGGPPGTTAATHEARSPASLLGAERRWREGAGVTVGRAGLAAAGRVPLSFKTVVVSCFERSARRRRPDALRPCRCAERDTAGTPRGPRRAGGSRPWSARGHRPSRNSGPGRAHRRCRSPASCGERARAPGMDDRGPLHGPARTERAELLGRSGARRATVPAWTPRTFGPSYSGTGNALASTRRVRGSWSSPRKARLRRCSRPSRCVSPHASSRPTGPASWTGRRTVSRTRAWAVP